MLLFKRCFNACLKNILYKAEHPHTTYEVVMFVFISRLKSFYDTVSPKKLGKTEGHINAYIRSFVAATATNKACYNFKFLFKVTG